MCAMKRRASSSEEPLGREPTMPYTHYAIIYLDNEGKLRKCESEFIRGVITSDICQNFISILDKRIKDQQAENQELDLSLSRLKNYQRGIFTGPTKGVPLRIGDKQKVRDYYVGAFNCFQQINCRIIAKAFIKLIEPRKQVKHPYNGGKPVPGSSPGTNGDPEKTKPEWWPPNVKHKEPDHMIKRDRILLLLHIIRELDGITSDELKEVAGETKRRLKHPNDVEIIYEILQVRKMEEKLKRDEVDADTVTHVKYYENKEDDNADNDDDYSAEAASAVFREPLPNKRELGALTTRIEPLYSTLAYSLPGSLSMPNPLSFEAGSQQNNLYHTAWPHVSPQYTTSAHNNSGDPGYYGYEIKKKSSQDTPVFHYHQVGDPSNSGSMINTDFDQDVSNPADFH